MLRSSWRADWQRKLSAHFGEVRLRVFGTSMVPSILPGDLVLIQRAGLHEISPGEVVLFLQKGRLFVHRVVDRKVVATAGRPEESCLITRGDRLRHEDPPVSSPELLGRVVSIERDNRKIELRAHEIEPPDRPPAAVFRSRDVSLSASRRVLAESFSQGGQVPSVTAVAQEFQRGGRDRRPSHTIALRQIRISFARFKSAMPAT